MYAFQVERLTTGYENTRIIESLNVSIQTGKITTIIGPNGCGKSTLLKTIGRILKQECGEIFLQEENMNTMSTKEIAKKLALLAQSPAAPGQLKVHELIAYGRYPHRKNVGRLTKEDIEKINWAMEVTHTEEFRDRELAALSGGQRQRVWLAMALAQETDILLLDEPTTYLDMAHQLEVLEIVQQLNKNFGCTIVMVLHDLNHAARFSDELIIMKKGAVLHTGTPEQMMTAEILKEVFQIEAKIILDTEHQVPVCFSYNLMK
ncbi:MULTISPECIES: ABC transporter ATP-binding protein [Solibacillus]|uniref:ABC transporter ATP-binding protein n=1 Tax=Solibacillus merdavium TaxID=2762218 RepID=A0ABR8XQ07_9BACL|nr:ABC transporter ATP-binding protein [Solibacillus merdavium]MBD8034038.1 ABC transporter ATP-binding protein [Solibacillus merdavium]